MKSKAEQSIERIKGIKYQLVIQSACIGVVAGIVVSGFRMILTKAEPLRGSVIAMAKDDHSMIPLLLLALAVCYLGAWLCLKIEPLCGGSGIPQVAGELKGKVYMTWWRVLLAKIIGASMAITGGLSLGREGPSIQIGAMVGKGFSRGARHIVSEEKLLITCGAAAGLAAAFNAPLAGAMFALEGLHKNFSTDILLGSLTASVSAHFVAFYFFGLTPVFDLVMGRPLPLHLYWMLLLLGVVLGLFGVLYGRCIAWCQDLYGRLPGRSVRLLVPFLLVIPLAILLPEVLGGGNWLVRDTSDGRYALAALAVLLAVKFCFSIISFSSGAPGGIFMPLLVLGGLAGGLFFLLLNPLVGVENGMISNFVVFGMVGYFAAIVRSPVTGIILITEMAGDFNNFLALSVVALVAYITADLTGTLPIYEQLLQRILSGKGNYGMTHGQRDEKVMMESDVYIASHMDGNKIKSMKLPEGSLIVAVQRDQQEIVPRGDTRLAGGDKLTILCRQGDMEEVDRILEAMCRRECKR